MPVLSVVTPVYNGAEFVARCYQSLLDQTFRDWEWVVVDDGSRDDTAAEVRKIADPRVRLVSYPTNMGRGFARTRGLAEARGEWLVIWDVDDFHFPERLAHIDEARLAGYEFFCSYAAVCGNDLTVKGIRGFGSACSGLPRTFVHPTMACRLDIARAIGYDASVRTGEDAEILWTLPARHAGLWCESALSVYQEDREVNLQKAIDSNAGHLRLLRKIFQGQRFPLRTGDYLRLSARYRVKLALLNLLKLKPELYLKSVERRSYGEVHRDYTLSPEQLAYIDDIKARFRI